LTSPRHDDTTPRRLTTTSSSTNITTATLCVSLLYSLLDQAIPNSTGDDTRCTACT
jgi:hypothetical protein